MNRRGFFAAVLAPLVVPWRPSKSLWWPSSFWPIQWCSRAELQRRLNQLYNQRIDNITLSL